MGYLLGLQDYLDQNYHLSVFDEALRSEGLWEMHLHEGRIVQARVVENQKYDIKITQEGAKEEILPKIHVKFLYPQELSPSVTPLIKLDKKVKDLGLEVIVSPRKRYHIKNKSLFPLMKEKRVLFFTLLEGEVLRGIVTAFSRYDITIHLKGGFPVTLLRHSVYDLRDKKGRCFLKSFQDRHRDWEKSSLYVTSSQG